MILPVSALAIVMSPFEPQFWVDVYRGQIHHDGDGNILVALLVRLLIAGLIVLGARLCVRMLHALITRSVRTVVERGGESQRRLTTLQGILASSLSYVVYFIAVLFILSTFGLNWKALAPLLGAASVLGLAIGFGAQKLVRDVITGLFILAEGQFDVGDWVTIGAVTGQIEDMGLRVTRLRDEQGRLYVIANGDITQVTNASRGRIRLNVEFPVQMSPGYEETLRLVQDVAEQVRAERIPGSDAGPAATVAVVGMSAATLTVRVTLWVPVAQKDAMEDTLRRQLLARFAARELTLA